MPLEYRYKCPLPNGVHARPACFLEEVARGFASDVTLMNERSGSQANAKSVLSIIGADIRLNDPCLLQASGFDEREAMAALSSFLREVFPHCDDALLAEAKETGESALPAGLRQAGVTIRRGAPVVPGIAQGKIVEIDRFQIPPELLAGSVADPMAEWLKLDEALQRTIASYDRRLARGEKGTENSLLKALRSIVRDSELHGKLRGAVLRHNRTAAAAITEAQEHFTTLLAATGNALLRERALDVQDVCQQLLRMTYGNAVGVAKVQLAPYSIVVAETLTPTQFLALDRHFLKGLVLAHAGTTSHTIILARSFGIPTLTGVPGLSGAKLNHAEAVLDGDLGALVTDLNDASRRYYTMEQRRLENRERHFWQFTSRPAVTRDGERLSIGANIATAEEAPRAFDAGVDGIGLFRTEILFMDRPVPPSEAEQYEIYRRVLTAAEDRPVVIRTLDVGGDKALAYLPLPQEENPFLGYRAVRLYAEFQTLFRTQIRALLRASTHGLLKVMFPMISTVDEARWARQIVIEEQARLAAERLPFNAAIPVGAMVEVPAAAFSLDALCRELDFFSIGSNDLVQYFAAADRANARLAHLSDPLQPAFLRLLRQIVAEIQSRSKTVNLCGEMGGQRRFLPLLVGLGLNEISVALPAVPGIKAALSGLVSSSCRRLLDQCLKCATAADVSELLEKFTAESGVPLIEPELVLLNADAASKEEAIKIAVDQLYVTGRTDRPRLVEDAVWSREAAYSTGFGHAFAIPHGKTNAVEANSLVIVKLRTPVEWGALDGQPVRVVILLVMRKTDAAIEHMKVFSQLARQATHEDFRARLEKESDPRTLCDFLRKTLQV